jgi:ribosomal protein S18 acetylase RimI-like enzyme
VPHTEALASAKISNDAWLGAALGYPVFHLQCNTDPALGADEGDRIDEAISQHCCLLPRALFYAKVPCHANHLLQRLQTAQLRVVDVSLTLGQATDPAGRPRAPDLPPVTSCSHLRIRLAQRADVEALRRISGSCFEHSRFHRDPLIPNHLAHALKQQWALAALEGGRCDRMWIAESSGQVAGFLASRIDVAEAGVRGIIDLVGVDRAHQRRGVGAALVQQFIRFYQEDCQELVVGTQAANLASLRLYQRLGFVIKGSHYVLHRHVQ